MLIALKFATVIQIAVNVGRKKQLHISLCVGIILLSKKFCKINSMIDCQSLRAFQILKSLKFFCMVTILNLKNLTAGIYPLLLLCRQTFPQLKDSVFKNFSMVSWCFQVRSWPDISYFIFFFFSWPPRSIILAPCQIWRQTRVNEIYENIIFGSDCF